MSLNGSSDKPNDVDDLGTLGIQFSDEEMEAIAAMIRASGILNDVDNLSSGIQQAAPPYNPYYSFKLSSPNHSVLPASQHEKQKKRKRHDEPLAEKYIQAENELDNNVLLIIARLKERHHSVNDNSITTTLNIDQTTLLASKMRLKEKGYLPEKGKSWHTITKKGIEHIDHLKKTQSFMDEPKIKRSRNSY